ncbi:MAG: dethiobiotin synthase [Waddliaceae bacterium]|nr:dethiobiotin synthase [Waddliaceae bacterium]
MFEQLRSSRKIFVTGTDTGVGKTLVSAILMRALSATYWKPIQSGLDEETDTDFVRRITELPRKHFLPEGIRLQAPLSPHASAALEGRRIWMHELTPPNNFNGEQLIIEGAGGLMVPLNDHDLLVDYIVELAVPVVLVARSGLGTINHTLLSLELLRNREVPILGVVMNGKPNPSNRQAIENYGHVDVLAEIPEIPVMSPAVIEKLGRRFDVRSEILV